MNHLIKDTFSQLKSSGKKALIPFLTADFPNRDTFLHLLYELPKNGATIIEIGIPFSDPMADGEVIQKTSLQAINNGFNLAQLLQDISAFKNNYPTIPIVLMTYLNPLFQFGLDSFLTQAEASQVDALLVVDLPPEQHDLTIDYPTKLNFIRLITPTTDANRLPVILSKSSGFLYYVSVKGITGTQQPNATTVNNHLSMIRSHIDLPLVIGFGISNATIAAEMATISDGVIVGSSFIAPLLKATPSDYITVANNQLSFIQSLSNSINNVTTT